MERFSGRRVLITGAGSGIGRATVQRIVDEGGSVFAVDLSADGLAGTVDLVSDASRVITHVADVTDEAAVKELVAAMVDQLGGIDVLLNIAGIHKVTPLKHLDLDDMRRMFEVNVVGMASMCREVAPHLQKGSVIISIASLSAHQGNPYMGAYAATKGAVLSFSRTLAAELLGQGVRVLTVSPGQVVTPLTEATPAAIAELQLDFTYYGRISSPLGGAQPEQIAGVLAFAASDDASYMTGVDIPVDGASHI